MNDVTLRFITLYEYMLKNNFFKSKQEFSKMIRVSASSLTEIFKGRTNVGMKIIMNTKLKFPEISAEWLLAEKGSMMFDTNKLDKDFYNKHLLKENKELKLRINDLENLLEAKSEIIQFLKEKKIVKKTT